MERAHARLPSRLEQTSEQCPVNFSQAGSYTVFVTFVSLFPYIVANFNESLPVGPSSESFTPSVTGVTFTQGDTVCGEWYCATLSASVDTYGLPTPESGDVGTVTFSWTGPDGSGSASAPVPDSIFTSFPERGGWGAARPRRRSPRPSRARPTWTPTARR